MSAIREQMLLRRNGNLPAREPVLLEYERAVAVSGSVEGRREARRTATNDNNVVNVFFRHHHSLFNFLNGSSSLNLTCLPPWRIRLTRGTAPAPHDQVNLDAAGSDVLIDDAIPSPRQVPGCACLAFRTQGMG